MAEVSRDYSLTRLEHVRFFPHRMGAIDIARGLAFAEFVCRGGRTLLVALNLPPGLTQSR